MHTVVVVLIVSALCADFLTFQGWAPKPVQYLPEVLAILVAVYVVGAGAGSRFRFVRGEYWVVLGLLAFTIGCGIVMNAVGSGPLFAGTRTYLRALPLFFVPAVLAIDDQRLRRQLLVVLGLALLQLPFAAYQRFTLYSQGRTTGDYVFGTLMGSGYLSVFLICAACVLTAMFVRGRIRALWFIPLLLLLLAPTMINETKATLLFLPVGLLATFAMASRRGVRLRNAVLGLCVFAVFLAIFIPVYDFFMKPRWGHGLIEFFTMEGRLEGYLSKADEVGAAKAGRLDGLVVPFRELARDPGTLAFGLGIGNASESALGEAFVGEHFRRFDPFIFSTSTTVLLETGLIGLLCQLALLWLILRDSLAVARMDTQGIAGALAAGWIGVTLVMTAALFYLNVQSMIAFVFWYFSGVVAARRMQFAARAVPLGRGAAKASLREHSNAAA